MTGKESRHNLKLIWLATLIIFIDQTTKLFAIRQGYAVYQQGRPAIFVVITLIALIWWLITQYHTTQRSLLGLIIIISGGLSNLFDRLIAGVVTDIVTVYSLTFNLADLFIIAGAFILLTFTYYVPKNQSNYA